MGPLEAGFDGERGITIMPPCEWYPKGITYRLLRGKKTPPESLDLRNKLVWWNPEGQPPTLYYINQEGEPYELSFNPVQKPFPLPKQY